MKKLAACIPIGLGDAIYIRAMLDEVKNNYDAISLNFHREIIKSYKFDEKYHIFLDDIGKLLFSESPYIIDEEKSDFYGIMDLCRAYCLKPIKPNLQNLLCKGKDLNLDQEYIVITTKVRYMKRSHIDTKIPELIKILNNLSSKYKIVILGEKITEMNIGYIDMDVNNIYYDIINNMPNNILDLTVPALGITAPNLIQIQQDCLIMNKAKLVITIGVGGGFCMATTVSNVVGYRTDDDPIANAVFNKEYQDAVITKNWTHFINTLNKYI